MTSLGDVAIAVRSHPPSTTWYCTQHSSLEYSCTPHLAAHAHAQRVVVERLSQRLRARRLPPSLMLLLLVVVVLVVVLHTDVPKAAAAAAAAAAALAVASPEGWRHGGGGAVRALDDALDAAREARRGQAR